MSEKRKVSVEEILDITEVIERIRKATGWTKQVWVSIGLAFFAGSGVTLGLASWFNLLVLLAILGAP